MPVISHLLHINAAPTQVYEKLSTIKGLCEWWTPDTSGSTEVGRELKFEFGPDYYKILIVEKSERGKLVSWRCTHAVEEWIGTVINLNLEANESGTLLRFEHMGWKETSDMLRQCSYDWALFLRSLKKLCDTGKGQPYPHQAEF